MNINLCCGFCSSKRTLRVVAEGWKVRYDALTNENAMCPEHSVIADFFDAQCPGCVAGWPNCGLHDSFAWCDRDNHGRPERRPLDEKERAYLLAGGCPRRVNGSMSFNTATREIKEENISEPASKESSASLLYAIDAYIAKWGKKQ